MPNSLLVYLISHMALPIIENEVLLVWTNFICGKYKIHENFQISHY